VKKASTLALPAGLLALAVLALNLRLVPVENLDSFLGVYPWVVLVLGVLLGLRFRRGRVVFALVALALADWALRSFSHSPASAGTAQVAFASTAFLLPVDLGWLALAHERGTLTWSGLARLTVIFAQVGLVALLWVLFDRGLTTLLERSFLPGVLVPTTQLSHLALLAFVFAFTATAVAWARTRTVIESGLFWAVMAAFLALAASGRATTAYLATAGLILVIALIEATFAMAYRDALTGLPARRAFDEALAKLSGHYAIAMVDIDNFKAFNDTYGHDVGDQVLRMIATRLSEIAGARAFRYGGEEFAVTFPGKARTEAAKQLEDVRERVAKDGFSLRGQDRPRRKPKHVPSRPTGTRKLEITISGGVAEQGRRLIKPEDVVRAADDALYRAKRDGRNRVRT
jgi:diguanylate cyclase (GGDEF)-like protein